MAGPSIVVRVLGDLKGLQGAFNDAGTKAQTGARNVHAAFSGVLGTLNQTGVLGPFGDSLASIDNALDRTAEHAKGIGTAMLGVGGTLVGVGIGLAALGSKDQAAHQQLQAAVTATGKSYDDYATQVEQAIKSQERFGHTANQTQDALRILTTATNDPAKALQLLGTASDLAAAKHEGLSEAATSLGKVYNGNTRLLKEFGIVVNTTAGATKAATTATTQAETADRNLAAAKQHLADLEAVYAGKTHLTTGEQLALKTAQEKVVTATDAAARAHAKATTTQQAAITATKAHGAATTELADKLKGQASAAADTFTGRLNAIKATVEDGAAQFGQKYGPAITAAGSAMTLFGGIMKAFQGTTAAAAAATDAQTAAITAQTVAVEAETVAVETEGAAALTADAASLPLIATVGLVVAGIIALGATAYIVYRNWKTIWQTMKQVVVDVWDWIRTNWPLLLAILTGPFGLAVLEIHRHWQGVLDFFRGFPRQIGGFFLGVAEALVWPFRTAFNDIADVWNNTVGSLSFHLPSWIPGIGGKGFDMPKIPHLAQGGLITQTGFVYAHAGEAITPAPAGVGGPAVHIENAHFNSDVDLEAFMRKAAWAVQTQRI